MTQSTVPIKSIERTSSTSSNTIAEADQSRPTTPNSTIDADSGILTTEKVRNLRKRSSSHMSASSDNSVTDKISVKSIAVANLKQQHQATVPLTTSEPNSNKPLTPLEELIKAASVMNPRQFELPREMNIYVQFPGTDKSK